MIPPFLSPKMENLNSHNSSYPEKIVLRCLSWRVRRSAYSWDYLWGKRFPLTVASLFFFFSFIVLSLRFQLFLSILRSTMLRPRWCCFRVYRFFLLSCFSRTLPADSLSLAFWLKSNHSLKMNREAVCVQAFRERIISFTTSLCPRGGGWGASQLTIY